MSFDLIIIGGTLIDGSGASPRNADVGIVDGRVCAVGTLTARGVPTVDATGCVVSPGFIDIHSHSDFTLLADPRAMSAIHQGVTTEVIGNCGFGCFPLRDRALARHAIYGVNDDLPLDWSSAGEYLGRLDAVTPAVNVATLVPNGQLRMASLGLAERPARADELAHMTRLLDGALADGAWGYSTGLEYAAESGAPEAEIVALCRVTARAGGLYATHTRDRDAGADSAVDEAIRTARDAAVRLQISHLLPRSGPEQCARCIARVDAAHRAGQDLAFDMHTRRFGLTYLQNVLPAWALAGSRAALEAALRDERSRQRMRKHRSIFSAAGDWDRVVLLDNEPWPQYARKSMGEIARERGQAPFDAAHDLLLGAGDARATLMAIIHCYDEEAQAEAFAHGLCVPGSDATDLATDGPLSSTSFHGAYTWAAWYYRFTVRERGLLSPEEAIHRLTGRPAAILGFSDRGVLRPGMRADITVFDPQRFAERGTLFEPDQLAEGVEHVFVNGRHTLANGRLTGTRAGEVLRHTRERGQV